MRSVRDLLRDYNFVNTAEGRRNTVRFFAGFLALAAGGFMALFVAFGGGGPSNSAYHSGAQSEDQFNVTATRIGSGEWYIGYPVDQYDPDQRHRYSEEAIHERLDQWQQGLDSVIQYTETVHSDDEHNVLLGYKVRLTQPGTISVL